MAHADSFHLRMSDIVATEICEQLEQQLLETGRLKKAYNCNPHHPDSNQDICEFQDLVDIVKACLYTRVHTYIKSNS